MSTIRLTMAQALVRNLANQRIETGGVEQPYFAGVWAIFGHGNVAGIGEALYGVRDTFPTYRGHNEQGMAHAAIAYAKASFRRSAMVCTSSIGPGATNFVTAAALAHVNRLPVLFLPGDVFANRRPDPVLQQVEDFADGTVSANDCFRPVSRYFDRITRPEQILTALPRTMATFMDPANCGPVTLALCQDVQAEAYDYPEVFFEPKVWRIREPAPDARELAGLVGLLRKANRPLIVAGGGVLYADAAKDLAQFVGSTGIPVAETQAGKGALSWRHPQNLGAIGVTGSDAANAAAKEADLVIGIGTRLQDFTTGSRSLFNAPDRRIIQVNINPYDAHKHAARPVVGDARLVLDAMMERLPNFKVSDDWGNLNTGRADQWRDTVDSAIAGNDPAPLQYAHAIGAVDRAADADSIVLCAAGTLPGELHKMWRTETPGGYHMEYGFSCMGYEVAGGLGAKLACPDREVFVLVGDGSYLMLNSELASAVAMGIKIIVVIFDSRGYSCINRLQQATGGASFNNLFEDTVHQSLPAIDYVAHAASLGANAEKADSIEELEAALLRARSTDASSVIVIDTEPYRDTPIGGTWWDVPVPEVSERVEVEEARSKYESSTLNQKVDG